jgi:hypothetical protein
LSKFLLAQTLCTTFRLRSKVRIMGMPVHRESCMTTRNFLDGLGRIVIDGERGSWDYDRNCSDLEKETQDYSTHVNEGRTNKTQYPVSSQRLKSFIKACFWVLSRSKLNQRLQRKRAEGGKQATRKLRPLFVREAKITRPLWA